MLESQRVRERVTALHPMLINPGAGEPNRQPYACISTALSWSPSPSNHRQAQTVEATADLVQRFPSRITNRELHFRLSASGQSGPTDGPDGSGSTRRIRRLDFSARIRESFTPALPKCSIPKARPNCQSGEKRRCSKESSSLRMAESKDAGWDYQQPTLQPRQLDSNRHRQRRR
jgi:hypothetical protein